MEKPQRPAEDKLVEIFQLIQEKYAMESMKNNDIARRRMQIWKNHNALQELAGLKSCDFYTFKRYVFNNDLSQIGMLIRAAEMARVTEAKQYRG